MLSIIYPTQYWNNAVHVLSSDDKLIVHACTVRWWLQLCVEIFWYLCYYYYIMKTIAVIWNEHCFQLFDTFGPISEENVQINFAYVRLNYF